eukprot:6054697-Pleurochrysis_carterae.AAC.3
MDCRGTSGDRQSHQQRQLRKRNGSLKAPRLCVQGCAQVPGVDFEQTFCATIHFGYRGGLTSHLATHTRCTRRPARILRRWDFVAAYLQGDLEPGEVVYSRVLPECPPPGYKTTGSDGRTRVFRIVKPVYGMAQTDRRYAAIFVPLA